MPFCETGLVCQPYEECAPTLDGGVCTSSRLEIAWVSPAGGTAFRTSPVPATLQVTKVDGGAVTLTSVPVTGAQGSFVGDGGSYSGQLLMVGADGTKTFIAGWQGAGLPSATLSLEKDTTAPTFNVAVVNAPTYGADDGGFLLLDPVDSRTGAIPLVKKDETVTVEVTSADSDVLASSVALTLRAGDAVWDAGLPANCGSATFCRAYTVALGPQTMNEFAEVVTGNVTGSDETQNVSSLLDAGVMRVTRWKWARRVVPASTGAIRAAPAIGADGTIHVGVANGGALGEGVFGIAPTGTSFIESSAGPVEAGLAIGRYNTGAEAVFFMTTNGGIQTLDAGTSCGVASTGNVGSLAILNDGAAVSEVAAPLMGVGVVGTATLRQLRGLAAGSCPANSIEATGATSMAYPGNVAVNGSDVWYAADDGTVRHFSLSLGTFTPAPTVTGLGAGTLYGISLFDSGGLKLAGGGGGAGVGRLFVKAANNTGPVSGYDASSHVSGVSVGSGNSLFAITQAAGEGTLRRFDATGVAVAAATLPPATFPFPSGSIPGATTPVLGNGGWVYATANDGTMVAADQTSLSVKWTKAVAPSIGGQVFASPTLDCNRTKPGSGTGIHYFATSTGWVVAYITESPGLDVTAPWPKYQHDARNTGRVGTSVACP